MKRTAALALPLAQKLALPLALLLGGLVPAAGVAQNLLVDRIVVRVNDRIATMVDFERQLVDRRQALLANREIPEGRRQDLLANAGREVLTDIYQDLLLLSRADQLGEKVSEADVDSAVAQMRERMGLVADDQLAQALASSGMRMADLRDRMRKNLLIQAVMGREVRPRLKVDEEQQRRYYREHPDEFTQPAAVHLVDVVVLEEGREPATVAATAKAVHDEIAGGAAIEEVVKKSAAAGTTTNLVDLGWVDEGDLDRDLERAIAGVAPGAITAPAQGRGGIHIAKVLERRAAALRGFEEVKEQVAAKLEESHMPEEYQGYLRELEGHSYIALSVPPEAEGFERLGKAAPAPGDVGLTEPPPAKPGAEPAKPEVPEKPPG